MNDRRLASSDAARGRGDLALSLAAATALALLAVTIATARERGVSARRVGPLHTLGRQPLPVEVVDDSAAVLSHWRERGTRGRVVLYASHFLHFVEPPEESEVPPLESFSRPRDKRARTVDHRDLLWWAMRENVGRAFVHLVPRAVLVEKGEGTGGPPGEPIETSELGTPRTLRADPPRLSEAVLVGVDASLFLDPEADALLARLWESGLECDDVVLSLARDNPAVGEPEREQILRLASELRGEGARR